MSASWRYQEPTYIDVGDCRQAIHELTVSDSQITAVLSYRNQVAAGRDRSHGQVGDVEWCGTRRQRSIIQPEIGANTDLLWTAYTGARASEQLAGTDRDRKSTRLNSSHPSISYAVFCLKKKKKK